MYSSIYLKSKREQSWLYGHPWIFSKAIQDIPHIEEGSLIYLMSQEGQALGTGYINFHQTIAIRMLSHDKEIIDSNWFYKHLSRLKTFKEKWLEESNAYRLCFGESDQIAGLVIDVYDKVAVVQINTKGIEKLFKEIYDALKKMGFHDILVDTSSNSAKKEKVTIQYQNPILSTIYAKENGLSIIVPQLKAQKTGWFCDQRDNRLKVFNLVKKQKLSSVLNLFSYTGGFSLYALKGGAQKVVNVDQDEEALNLFKEMVHLNQLKPCFENIHQDIWHFFKTHTETYDLVIVDPPAFAKEESKKMQGLKGYLDLFKNAITKVSKGGFMMVYSCSHFITQEDLNWVLRQAFFATKRSFQTIETLHQAQDHSVPAYFPESSYLKGYLLAEI